MFELADDCSLEKRTKRESENTEYLIGIDGFASQEIINLMLVGKAVPHLFDGNQERDFGGSETSLLHGIPHKSEIGLLSALDQHCAIGSFYKNPMYPIFLLICGHHYTVLFGTSKRILMNSQDEFILHHYDGFDKTETAFIISMLNFFLLIYGLCH
nr:probable ubiquitin carboxyl-terminal hydrolase MINDY-4 [Parasteatoda tepidariorum]